MEMKGAVRGILAPLLALGVSGGALAPRSVHAEPPAPGATTYSYTPEVSMSDHLRSLQVSMLPPLIRKGLVVTNLTDPSNWSEATTALAAGVPEGNVFLSHTNNTNQAVVVDRGELASSPEFQTIQARVDQRVQNELKTFTGNESERKQLIIEAVTDDLFQQRLYNTTFLNEGIVYTSNSITLRLKPREGEKEGEVVCFDLSVIEHELLNKLGIESTLVSFYKKAGDLNGVPQKDRFHAVLVANTAGYVGVEDSVPGNFLVADPTYGAVVGFEGAIAGMRPLDGNDTKIYVDGDPELSQRVHDLITGTHR